MFSSRERKLVLENMPGPNSRAVDWKDVIVEEVQLHMTVNPYSSACPSDSPRSATVDVHRLQTSLPHGQHIQHTPDVATRLLDNSVDYSRRHSQAFPVAVEIYLYVRN